MAPNYAQDEWVEGRLERRPRGLIARLNRLTWLTWLIWLVIWLASLPIEDSVHELQCVFHAGWVHDKQEAVGPSTGRRKGEG